MTTPSVTPKRFSNDSPNRFALKSGASGRVINVPKSLLDSSTAALAEIKPSLCSQIIVPSFCLGCLKARTTLFDCDSITSTFSGLLFNSKAYRFASLDGLTSDNLIKLPSAFETTLCATHKISCSLTPPLFSKHSPNILSSLSPGFISGTPEIAEIWTALFICKLS